MESNCFFFFKLFLLSQSASDLPGRSYADRCDAVAVVRLLRRDAGRSPSSSSVLVVAESTSKATPAAADAGHPLRPVFEPRVHEFVVDDDVPLHVSPRRANDKKKQVLEVLMCHLVSETEIISRALTMPRQKKA